MTTIVDDILNGRTPVPDCQTHSLAGTRDPKGQAVKLLAEYDAWRDERADLSAQECSGPTPDSDDWHASDDTGCDLAASFAALVRVLTAEPTTPAAIGKRDCLGCNAVLADTATYCWQCKDKDEQAGEEYEADLGEPYLLCTHCGVANGIYENETSQRWTPFAQDGMTELEADGTVRVKQSWNSNDGDGYEDDGYMCEGPARKPAHVVTIPDHWKIDA